MRAKVPVWRVVMDVPLRLTLLGSFGLYPPLILFLPWLFGSAFERFMGVTRGSVSRAKVGLAAIPVLILPRILPLVGFVAAASIDTPIRPLRWLVGIVVWLIASVIFYPLYAAPLEVLERGVGLMDGVVSAAARSGRQPLGKVIVRASAVACAGALPFFPAPLLLHSPAVGVLLMLALGLISPTCVVALVAHAWSDGNERFGDARTPRVERVAEAPLQGPMRRRLASALVLAMAPLVVVGCTLIGTVLTPTRARDSLRQTRLATMSDLHADIEGQIVFPTNSGLTARLEGSHVVLATADGGGAGEVGLSCTKRDALRHEALEATAFRDTYRGQDVWTYRLASARCEDRISFNDEGVRVDDTTSDRITQRWGGAGMWLAFAVVLLCALAAFDQLRWVGRARNLDATRKELLGTVAIEGRIAGDSVAFTKGSKLTAPQGLRIDLGEHGHLTLPPEGTLTLLHPALEPQTLVAGNALSIITTLQPQQGSPFRDGHAQSQHQLRVVAGTLDQARRAYVEFATRRMAMTGIVSLIASVVFAVVGLVQL